MIDGKVLDKIKKQHEEKIKKDGGDTPEATTQSNVVYLVSIVLRY